MPRRLRCIRKIKNAAGSLELCREKHNRELSHQFARRGPLRKHGGHAVFSPRHTEQARTACSTDPVSVVG